MMSLTFFLPLLLSHMTDHMTGQELVDEDRYNNYKAQFNSKCESLGQKSSGAPLKRTPLEPPLVWNHHLCVHNIEVFIFPVYFR